MERRGRVELGGFGLVGAVVSSSSSSSLGLGGGVEGHESDRVSLQEDCVKSSKVERVGLGLVGVQSQLE